MLPAPTRRLLVIDPGGAVALDTLDGQPRQVLCPRPETGPGRGPTEVRTAVWSAAGQWAAVAIDSDDVDGPRELRLHREGAEIGAPSVLADGLTAFYLSPSPCGRFLSHLSPGPLGLELAVSDVRSNDLRILERGQPLFWAWRPDSAELAIHVENRTVRTSLDGPAVEVASGAESFLAPWWTPAGSLVIARDGALVSHHPDGGTTVVAPASGSGRFSVDPQGRRVALIESIEGLPCLVVLDPATGDRDIVTAERAAAFFWSPDGRRLAALVLADARRLQWIVFDTEAGPMGISEHTEQVQRLEPFRPGVAWLRQVLPFFEQYAHSHQVWSPDASELVAPAVDADGSTEAVIQRVAAPFSTEHLPGVRLAWWAGPSPTPAAG